MTLEQAQQELRSIFDRLALPHLPLRLEEEDIDGWAFQCPNEWISITQRALALPDDQVRAILAHEAGHCFPENNTIPYFGFLGFCYDPDAVLRIEGRCDAVGVQLFGKAAMLGALKAAGAQIERIQAVEFGLTIV